VRIERQKIYENLSRKVLARSAELAGLAGLLTEKKTENLSNKPLEKLRLSATALNIVFSVGCEGLAT